VRSADVHPVQRAWPGSPCRLPLWSGVRSFSSRRMATLATPMIPANPAAARSSPLGAQSASPRQGAQNGLFWGRSPVEDRLWPGVLTTIGGGFGLRGD
jgi:hypothetical protein